MKEEENTHVKFEKVDEKYTYSAQVKTSLYNLLTFLDLGWSYFYFSMRAERVEHLDKGLLVEIIKTINILVIVF